MDAIIAESVGIAFCLLISAFFSGSETALTSLSHAQAQKLFEETNARHLKLWLDRPIHVLTTILIGNNIVNITASALATDLANRLLAGTSASEWAIPAAVGVMTFLLLTFGEITPKAIAKRLFKPMSVRSMFLLRPFYYFFYPATYVFNSMTRLVMRLTGNDPNAPTPFVTAEEIEYMIDLGSREGTFTEDRERLLRSVFEFNDTIVREIMVPRTDMIVVDTEMTLPEIVEIFLNHGHSRIPVYEDTIDNIIGIFYAKDLLELFARANGEAVPFDLRAHLRKPFFIPESKHISDLLADFQRQRIHMAVIVDEFGGVDGLITLEDIIEEFVGEIQDEHDAESEQITVIDERTIRVDGRLPIYELEEYLHTEFPEDADYETIGGFMMTQLGTVPSIGDRTTWMDLLFEVLEADEKKVIAVEIQRVVAQEPGEQLVS